MEQGRKYPLDEVREIAVDHLTRQRRDTDRNSANGFQVQVTTKEQAQAAEEAAKRTGQATLDLVRQTAQVIKLAEDRGQALADRGQELAQRAVNELKIAEARIKFLEERLRQAETRARDAEEWLQRVHDAIQRNLVDRPMDLRRDTALPSSAA